MGLERVNKWPNSMKDIWLWWWWTSSSFSPPPPPPPPPPPRNKLTLLTRANHKKPTSPHLVNNFPRSFQIHHFIIVFIKIGSVLSQMNPCLTLELTPWRKGFLGDPTALQLLKNIPVFYGTRRFIACPCPQAKETNSRPPILISSNAHSNIILPSTPGSSKWSLSLRFSHQNPICIPPLPHTCHMPNTTHSYIFYKLKNILWLIRIMKILITPPPPVPCYLVSLRPKYLPQHPILKHPQPTFLL